MRSTIELPNDKTITVYYTDKVYSPRHSAVSNVVVADMFLPATGTLLDVACGTGVIALGIKKLNPKAIIEACDIDPKAVRIAKKNSDDLKLPIKVYQNDLLKGLPKDSYDMIVANLPTFDSEDMDMHDLHGPKVAYYADEDDGLKLYKELFDQLDCLKPNGFLVCECQEKLHKGLRKLATEHGFKPLIVAFDTFAFVRNGFTV
jgi:release factor glutamine methyltransferase